ncbi:hypothetical protein HDU96_004704, partial [Phlyctochytrium bullatum]
TDVVAALPQVKNLAHVHNVPRPVPAAVSTTDALKFAPEGIHSITGVNDVRAKLGLTGKGVKVAVIDSGIAYDHPALGGGFGPGYKVAFGYDLVGDAYTGDPATAVEDPDPLDGCSEESHGTHVAGIVGADARNITDPAWKSDIEFTGVAPGVTLGAFRVFGCSGGAGSDVIAKAIYKAAEAGADIINLSLGGGPTFADGVDAVAADRVGQAGKYVFASNGNDGANGILTGGSPGTAQGGFGIASFDNVEVPAPYLTIQNTKTDFSYNIGSSNGNFNFEQELEVIANDLTADELDKQDDGSAATPTVNARGKALLIRWGDAAFGGSC